MTELDTVLNAYRVLVDCQEIVSGLLTKSRKGKIFHGTVFLTQPLEKAKSLLTDGKADLDDLTIVSLVSVFERIIFDHPNSSLRKKQVRQNIKGPKDAIKHFQRQVQPCVYQDTQRLCDYRDWVAHGKRWNPPVQADPINAYTQLTDFLIQAGLGHKS